MKQTQRRIDRFVTIVAFLALLVSAGAVWGQGQGKAVPGFAVGRETDEIVPGRFIVDPG